MLWEVSDGSAARSQQARPKTHTLGQTAMQCYTFRSTPSVYTSRLHVPSTPSARSYTHRGAAQDLVVGLLATEYTPLSAKQPSMHNARQHSAVCAATKLSSACSQMDACFTRDAYVACCICRLLPSSYVGAFACVYCVCVIACCITEYIHSLFVSASTVTLTREPHARTDGQMAG